MGEELVSVTSSQGGGASASHSSTLLTYSAEFEKQFPMYLVYGMTAEEYWHGDCRLVIGYREAFKLKQELANQNLWLQGMYVYDALCNASPLFVATGKKGKVSARPYPKEPYDLGYKREEREEAKAKKQMEKMKAYMEVRMIEGNKKFNKEVK